MSFNDTEDTLTTTECQPYSTECDTDSDGFCCVHEQWECGCRPGHDCPTHLWDDDEARENWEDDE